MSSLNCKAGDLAVVIGLSKEPWCLGLSVTCLEIMRPGSRYRADNGDLWECRENAWVVDRDLWGQKYPDTRGTPAHVISDRFLLPIRPEADPEAMPTEQEVSA